MDDYVVIGIVYLTLVRCDLSVLLKTAFKSGNTLRSHLTKVKDDTISFHIQLCSSDLLKSLIMSVKHPM